MLYNRGGILSVSIDQSCIFANLQKLQGSFTNSLETNPILNVVGSSEAHTFWFSALLYSRHCTRLLVSVARYPCDSFDLLWPSRLAKCVHQEWCTARWVLFGWYTITIGKGNPRAVSMSLAHTELNPARYIALLMSYGVQKCSAPCWTQPLVFVIHAQSIVCFLASVGFVSSEPCNFSTVYLLWKEIGSNFKIP